MHSSAVPTGVTVSFASGVFRSYFGLWGCTRGERTERVWREKQKKEGEKKDQSVSGVLLYDRK